MNEIVAAQPSEEKKQDRAKAVRRFAMWSALSLLIMTAVFAILDWVYGIPARAAAVGFEDKKLWQWMELLIVPLTLAMAVWLFERLERNSDREASAKRMKHELEVTGERNELDREITRKTVNQRSLESFLEYVSKQLLTDPAPIDAESLRIVILARTLETLDSLSDDSVRRDRALGFIQDLELLKPKSDRKKNSDLEPLFYRTKLVGLRLVQAKPEDRRVDLRGVDFSGSTLSHCILDGADMTGCTMEGADLSGVKLAGALLVGANLQGAILEEAKLTGTDLTDAKLSAANLRGARLDSIVSAKRAELRDCDLENTDLRSANLVGAVFDHARFHSAITSDDTMLDRKWWLVNGIVNGAKVDGRDLHEEDLGRARLDGAHLSEALLTKATLSESDLSNAHLSEADLREANLQSANLSEADLSGADLRNAGLQAANLRRATLSHARLHGARIDERTQLDSKWRLVWEILNAKREQQAEPDATQSDLFASLDDSSVDSKSLRNQDLSHADLTGADLRGFDLAGANLEAAILVEADLIGANISGADLTGADLTGADLSGADLRGAIVTAEQLEVALNVPEREVW